MPFAECVKNVRRQLNLSQQALADLLGVSFSTINRWENGRHKPSRMAINTLASFCKLKNISFNYTIGEEDQA